jgi:hypothetical protein
VTINDDGGSTTTDTGTASIAGASLTPGTASLIGGVADLTATVLTAPFISSYTNAPITDYSGTIAWGDGSTTRFTSAAVSVATAAMR